MKKLNLIGILLGIAIVPAALAGTISGTQTPGAHFADGGEITAVASPHVAGLTPPGGGPGFQTFCIESQILFNNGTTYTYTPATADHAGHPLTLGAAWLFSQFSGGALSVPGFTYNYTPGAGREESAGAVQEALWMLQGQTIPAAFSGNNQVNSDANTIVNAVAAATGGHQGNAANGAFGVEVLSLSDATGAPIQDWLGIVPVPDGGTTIALLGFALVGVESLRRKLAR